MKSKKRKSDVSLLQDYSAEAIGLSPNHYAAALRYLFERPVPASDGEAWYWSDEPELTASHLEWTRIQTVLFANAGADLAPYNNEQVGMGLNYIMSNSISNIAYAAVDPSVPQAEAMRMMDALPTLWLDCIGPRLAHCTTNTESHEKCKLSYVCHMWFDVWPTFFYVCHLPYWQDALWNVLKIMLNAPYRHVQMAALHGIGHEIESLDRTSEIQQCIRQFIRTVPSSDEELRNYAEAASQGYVL